MRLILFLLIAPIFCLFSEGGREGGSRSRGGSLTGVHTYIYVYTYIGISLSLSLYTYRNTHVSFCFFWVLLSFVCSPKAEEKAEADRVAEEKAEADRVAEALQVYMCIYVYIYICVFLSLSLSIYI